jgi:orotate phosphoribosyltransferase
MKPYQIDFIRLALDAGVLRFGEFALKSGRSSPYFFNIGAIAGGMAMARLAEAYAAAYRDAGLDADLLFGPAYKGIPLAATMATALAGHGLDLGYAYNRKEAKGHGEGGTLVGADPAGQRVVVVDDVLTAGTALRQSVALLREAGAEPVAAMIALDRQERGTGAASAVEEAEAELGLRVVPLVTVAEVMTHLARAGTAPEALAAMRDYQARHGTATA